MLLLLFAMIRSVLKSFKFPDVEVVAARMSNESALTCMIDSTPKTRGQTSQCNTKDCGTITGFVYFTINLLNVKGCKLLSHIRVLLSSIVFCFMDMVISMFSTSYLGRESVL